jgi:dolichol-phosphate mannosyltransferase
MHDEILVFTEKQPASHHSSLIHAGSSTMNNVDLARQDDFGRVSHAQESPVMAGPELTVVIPTLNERDNIGPLVDLLDAVLDTVSWEAIFVDDDSPDGTAERIREISRCDRRVRCLQRIGRRGLTTACIEGALAASAPYVAVMDADMQHDEMLLPQMLTILKSEPVDLVVGSRYVAGGGIGGWDAARANMSAIAARLSRIICKAEIADPMSGFFMLRREVLEGVLRRLSGQGFKILLDILASSPRPLRFRELPYEFRERQRGESKLDALVAWEYMMLIADKLIGHIVPVRFALFAFVGGIGLFIHMSVLWFALTVAGAAFNLAQASAAVAAMTSNFFVNNLLTYRDRRLRGFALVRGLFTFYAICALGAVANVGIAGYVFSRNEVWWLAGLAGVVVGSVWNYAVSSVFTWKQK